MEFDLERTAEELFAGHPSDKYVCCVAYPRGQAIRLARSALEAAAKECEAASAKDKIYGLLWAASIIRRVAELEAKPCLMTGAHTGCER